MAKIVLATTLVCKSGEERVNLAPGTELTEEVCKNHGLDEKFLARILKSGAAVAAGDEPEPVRRSGARRR